MHHVRCGAREGWAGGKRRVACRRALPEKAKPSPAPPHPQHWVLVLAPAPCSRKPLVLLAQRSAAVSPPLHPPLRLCATAPRASTSSSAYHTASYPLHPHVQVCVVLARRDCRPHSPLSVSWASGLPPEEHPCPAAAGVDALLHPYYTHTTLSGCPHKSVKPSALSCLACPRLACLQRRGWRHRREELAACVPASDSGTYRSEVC